MEKPAGDWYLRRDRNVKIVRSSGEGHSRQRERQTQAPKAEKCRSENNKRELTEIQRKGKSHVLPAGA